MAEFVLSCELVGHEEDVRGVCSLDGGRAIATASRDKTVKLWRLGPGSPPHLVEEKTFVGHTGFVGPVCEVPSSAQLSGCALVSGGMDCRVIVWDVTTGVATQELCGHEQQVTGVAMTTSGDIVTSSVDKTLRVWRDGQCTGVLEGHESSVLCVLTRPTGEIYSGSGDCTIRCWRNGTCVRTIRAHSDSVRGLGEMPGLGLLSASHDGSVKLWDWEGNQLLEMVGHTALVYSVAASCPGPGASEGDIASGSEDCTARIWRNGACVQTLEHPGCVWAVTFLPNGDLVTACADGVGRVWTRDPARMAEAAARTHYEDLVRARKRSKTVGGVNVEDLPGPEALQQPGRKDGQTKIVREGDVGVAYSWNAKEYNWDRIGEVVDGPSDPMGSRTHNGKAYDYVFDVDIGDGVPVRKLPCNKGDNPYEVADRWLLEQDLPLGYREQIVGFIIQNTGQGNSGATRPTSSSSPFLPMGDVIPDPYTGGQAYVPQASAGRPSAAPSAAPASWGVTGMSAQPQGADKSSALPKRSMLVFDTAPHEAIQKKIKELNSALAATASTPAAGEAPPPHVMGNPDVARLEAIMATLRDTSHYHSSTFGPADIRLIATLLASWPLPNLFPLLDVLRLMLLHPSAAALLAEDASEAAGAARSSALSTALQRAASGNPPLGANLLTGLRVAVNAFRHTSLFKAWLLRNRMEILDSYSGSASSNDKKVRLAFATLVLNFALLLVESRDEEGQIQLMSAAVEAGSVPDEDPTTLQRLLLGIATLVQDGGLKQLAVDLDVGALAEAASNHSNGDVAHLGSRLAALLK